MPRFQFTIANLLAATFWWSIWFSTWAAAFSTRQELGIILLAAGALAIFLGVGALFGRTWLGFGAGLIAIWCLYFSMR